MSEDKLQKWLWVDITKKNWSNFFKVRWVTIWQRYLIDSNFEEVTMLKMLCREKLKNKKGSYINEKAGKIDKISLSLLWTAPTDVMFNLLSSCIDKIRIRLRQMRNWKLHLHINKYFMKMWPIENFGNQNCNVTKTVLNWNHFCPIDDLSLCSFLWCKDV